MTFRTNILIYREYSSADPYFLLSTRREKNYRILTASAERERISRRKKQLEQEIELIERKIYLEEMMHIARKRNSRPQMRRVIARYDSF